MTKITNGALFFLAAGIFTSVSILSVYQVLFTIPLIYYTYLALKEKNFVLPKSAWFLIAFTVIALISLVINFDIIPKPGKNFGRLKYFAFGFLGIYVFQAWLKETSDKTKNILVNAFLATIVIAAIYAMINFGLSKEKRAKGLTDTMRYGYGSAMMLLTLLSAMLHQDKIKSWFNWKLAAPVFILGFVGMYLTYTRGALLGFICGLPFVVYYYKRKWGLAMGSLALIVVIGLGSIYLFSTQRYESRFLSNKNNRSDMMRRSQWQSAIIAIKERPMLGWGLSNFHTQLKRIKTEHDLEAKFYDDAHSHNLFLEIGSGTGLIGLFFFLGWLISWAVESMKSGPLVRAMVVPLGVAFVVSGQFEVTFDANNASMIFFVYALSSAVSLKSPQK